MRDPDRIDNVLDALEAYWTDNPDLRLAQIVGNAGQRNGFGTDPYYMEDDALLRYLEVKNSSRDGGTIDGS